MNRIFFQIKSALTANYKPGLFLWFVLIIFIVLYYNVDSFSQKLNILGKLKTEYGFYFSFISYAIVGSLIPEILKCSLIEKNFSIKNIYNIIFGVILWGCVGIYTDTVYYIQQIIFGNGTTLDISIKKTVVDQLFYSPLCACIITSSVYGFENFKKTAWISDIFTKSFLIEHIVPTVVALWLVWIPSMVVVYSMPIPLQLPIACCISCFWSLVITFIAKHD